MPVLYHYTGEEGAQNILRTGTIQATLKHMTWGDTAYGNGVYLTTMNPWTSSKDEIMMNNWSSKGRTEREKMKGVFILSIPETDIKKAEKTLRDIYLFGDGKDLRLHKYPWMLKCYSSDRIIASYKYEVVSQASKPDAYEGYIGDYVMSDEIVNGSPMYESSKNCLFMKSDGNWYLGPDIKTPMIRQDGNFSQGPNVTGEWECLNSDGFATDSHLEIRPCSLNTKPSDFYLSDLHKQLMLLIAMGEKWGAEDAEEDKAEDPKAQATWWVNGWVDYRDKYGFGYALSDGSIGVVFNDFTKILAPAEGSNVLYINERGEEHNYTVNEFHVDLEKKLKLLERFRNSAKKNLVKTSSNTDGQELDQLSRVPYLNSWLKISHWIFMHLTNGTLQINSRKDHTKIILCPLQRAVTYIDAEKKKRTFRFDLLKKYGCSQKLTGQIILGLALRYDERNGETGKKLQFEVCDLQKYKTSLYLAMLEKVLSKL